MNAILPQDQTESGFVSSILAMPEADIPTIDPQAFTGEIPFIIYSAFVKAKRAGRTPTLATINGYIEANPRFLGDMRRIAKERGHDAETWTNFVFQLPELVPSKGLVADMAADLTAAHIKRQQAEVARLMTTGEIEPPQAIEMLQKLTSSASKAPGFVDLAPFLDGTARQEVPTVAEAWVGRCLFYAGRLNEIHAEPGTGKTNVLMAACDAVLESGGSIVYIDPEDTPKGFATRMLMLGADPGAIRSRVHYLHNPDPAEIRAAQIWAKDHNPAVVILDGLAESMAAVGANEDKAQEVLAFFRGNLRPFAEAGAAVVIADHVTKSSEGRGQFARGSGAKAGRYDGVSYDIVAGREYTPTVAGFVKLRIAKDRNGGAGPRGKIVAELHFTPGADGRTITEFREPEERAESGKFVPTVIIGKIREYLAVYKTATTRSLRTLGKSQTVDLAIKQMIESGEMEVTAKGQSHLYSMKETEQ